MEYSKRQKSFKKIFAIKYIKWKIKVWYMVPEVWWNNKVSEMWRVERSHLKLLVLTQSAAILSFDAEIWAYGKYMLLQMATNLLLQDATNTYIRKSKRPGRNDPYDVNLTRKTETGVQIKRI